jgi:hypothetical protein
MQNPSIGFYLYNLGFMFMIVHLCARVLWNPNERIVNDNMICLVCRLSVEDEWSKAARDRPFSRW